MNSATEPTPSTTIEALPGETAVINLTIENPKTSRKRIRRHTEDEEPAEPQPELDYTEEQALDFPESEPLNEPPTSSEKVVFHDELAENQKDNENNENSDHNNNSSTNIEPPASSSPLNTPPRTPPETMPILVKKMGVPFGIYNNQVQNVPLPLHHQRPHLSSSASFPKQQKKKKNSSKDDKKKVSIIDFKINNDEAILNQMNNQSQVPPEQKFLNSIFKNQ